MLLVAGIGVFACLVILKTNSDKNKELADTIASREAEIARLKGEGEKVQQQLTPEQKAVLGASHKLVNNKMFGWSRLFADLESVLPPNVSASRITVQNIYNDGDRVKAELELGVLSRDYSAVMNMIENMHNSGLFQAELRGQDLQKNERLVFRSTRCGSFTRRDTVIRQRRRPRSQRTITEAPADVRPGPKRTTDRDGR